MSGNSTTPDPGALPEFIASILRNGLQALAGTLVTKGILTSDQTTGFIGAGVFIFALGWSLFQKWQARKRLSAAILAPAGKATP